MLAWNDAGGSTTGASSYGWGSLPCTKVAASPTMDATFGVEIVVGDVVIRAGVGALPANLTGLPDPALIARLIRAGAWQRRIRRCLDDGDDRPAEN